VLTPALPARSEAFASGASSARTQRRFSARVQYRRFSFDVRISIGGHGASPMPTHSTSVSRQPQIRKAVPVGRIHRSLRGFRPIRDSVLPDRQGGLIPLLADADSRGGIPESAKV
jgi:hypothetical protein